MVKKVYICTDCSKTFSRKYNAERHNEKIHNQMASIYDKQTRWISDNTKIGYISQAQQGSFPLPTTSSTTTSSTLLNKENKNKDNNILNSMYNTIKDFNLLDLFSTIYNKNEIEGTFKILGKMLLLWMN